MVAEEMGAGAGSKGTPSVAATNPDPHSSHCFSSSCSDTSKPEREGGRNRALKKQLARKASDRAGA